jgi:acetyl-CoA carboxylase biotin carboxylase subunit
MFSKVAVANRGCAAARLVKALNRLKAESLILCSEADRDNPYVSEATSFKVIGGPAPKDSYLNAGAVVQAAREAGCDAVHPGWGFLAEDAAFAEAVRAGGMAFVGPSPKWLEMMGDKVKAREAMGRMGFPLNPSTGMLTGTPEEMAERASEAGFPLLVKPASGGGGIGMIPVHSRDRLLSAMEKAQSQAERSFAKRGIYAERLLLDPRHVEFQVVADGGGSMHLYERDCSVQRRRQKVVEEAGAPNIDPGLLEATSVKAAGALGSMGYDSIGTVETLYSRDTGFAFLEVNPRLQVEHAATEETTGVDLAGVQLRLACGEKISDIFPQGIPKRRGHSVEARIYAEDSLKFLPSPGPLKVFRPPSGKGIRIETGFKEGGVVTPFYDPMIAQVIVWAGDRLSSLDLMHEALCAFEVEGVKTNCAFIRALMKHPPFREGCVHTGLAEELIKSPGYTV